MIKMVRHEGKVRPAIMLDVIDSMDNVSELHDALIDIMSSCLYSDEVKEGTSSTSLWFLLHLIRETSADRTQQKGGES